MSVEKGRNTVMKCEATAPGPRKEPVRIEWFQDKIPVDLSDPRLTVVEPGILVVKVIHCFNDNPRQGFQHFRWLFFYYLNR